MFTDDQTALHVLLRPPENTYWRGKDDCSAGLQFNKFVRNQLIKYVICMYLVKQLNPNL